MQFRLRDVPPGEAGPGGSASKFTLVALLRPVEDSLAEGAPAPEERLIVDSSGAVRSGTQGALSLLGVSATELDAVTVFVADIIPGWTSAAQAAGTEQGAVVFVRVR